METVKLIVYGTLMSGERNHRFCRNAVSIAPCTVSGTRSCVFGVFSLFAFLSFFRLGAASSCAADTGAVFSAQRRTPSFCSFSVSSAENCAASVNCFSESAL